jgi:hypothetical protein
MAKFKVGDVVECIDAISSPLIVGNLYIILKIDRCFLDVTTSVSFPPSAGKIYSGWQDNRFRLAGNTNNDTSSDVDYLEILKEY